MLKEQHRGNTDISAPVFGLCFMQRHLSPTLTHRHLSPTFCKHSSLPEKPQELLPKPPGLILPNTHTMICR